MHMAHLSILFGFDIQKYTNLFLEFAVLLLPASQKGQDVVKGIRWEVTGGWIVWISACSARCDKCDEASMECRSGMGG